MADASEKRGDDERVYEFNGCRDADADEIPTLVSSTSLNEKSELGKPRRVRGIVFLDVSGGTSRAMLLERRSHAILAQSSRRRLAREKLNALSARPLALWISRVDGRDVHEKVSRVREIGTRESKRRKVLDGFVRVADVHQTTLAEQQELREHGVNRRPRLMNRAHDRSSRARQLFERKHAPLRLERIQPLALSEILK